MTKRVKMSLVRTDGGTQMRTGIDKALVTTYAEDISNKVEFPPVDVFHDGEAYWLADGFHRFYAHVDNGAKTIVANVHKGSQRDAILFSVGANASHGLRRTNADKRKAVMALLEDEEWSQWSDRAIAKRCGVHHQMVSRHREVDESPTCATHVVKGQDGKTYPRKPPSPRRKKKTLNLPDPDSFPDAEPEELEAEESEVGQPRKRLKTEARVASQEMLQTVKAFLRLNPAAEDVETILNALAQAHDRCELYLTN